jgi:hypothetical protein
MPLKEQLFVIVAGFLTYTVTAHPFLELRFNWAIDRRIAV